jgi:hypothetical protein
MVVKITGIIRRRTWVIFKLPAILSSTVVI